MSMNNRGTAKTVIEERYESALKECEEMRFKLGVWHIQKTDLETLCEQYFSWKTSNIAFLELVGASQGTLSEFRENDKSDIVIQVGVSDPSRGDYSDEEIVEAMLKSTEKRLAIVRTVDQKLLHKIHGLHIVSSDNKHIKIGYDDQVSDTPLSRADQFVGVLEYVLLNARREDGSANILNKGEVWKWMVERHEIIPFTKAPKEKGSGPVRNSVDRHLENIENELKTRFPQLKTKNIFKLGGGTGEFICTLGL